MVSHNFIAEIEFSQCKLNSYNKPIERRINVYILITFEHETLYNNSEQFFNTINLKNQRRYSNRSFFTPVSN